MSIDRLNEDLARWNQSIDVVSNRSKLFGTVEGPEQYRYDLATSPVEKLGRVKEVMRVRTIISEVSLPRLREKVEDIQVKIEHEEFKINVRNGIMAEFGIEELERAHQAGTLTDFDLQVVSDAMEQEIRIRSGEAPPIVNPILEKPKTEQAPNPARVDNEKIFSVTFPNGNTAEVTDERDSKILGILSQAMDGMQNGAIDIPQDVIVRGVFNRFEVGLAEDIRDRLAVHAQTVDSVGYQIDRIDRMPSEQHDRRLRHIYRVQEKKPQSPTERHPSPGANPAEPDKAARRSEEETLSESEKVLKALDLLLADENIEAARVVDLMTERLEKNLGVEGVNLLNTVSYLIKELNDIFDCLNTDRIYQPQLALWERIRISSGQSEDFLAKKFFETRVKNWYNRMVNEDGKSASVTATKEGELLIKRARVYGAFPFVLSNGGTYIAKGGVAKNLMEVLIMNEGQGLTAEILGMLAYGVGKNEAEKRYNTKSARSAANNLRLDPELAEVGYEVVSILPEGRQRSPDTKFMLRPIPGVAPEAHKSTKTVILAGAPALTSPEPEGADVDVPQRKESANKNQLEAELIQVIAEFDLVNQPEFLNGAQVTRVVHNLTAQMQRKLVDEGKYLQPHHTEGKLWFFTSKQIAQMVLIIDRMRSGGVRKDFLKDLFEVTDRAYSKAEIAAIIMAKS